MSRTSKSLRSHKPDPIFHLQPADQIGKCPECGREHAGFRTLTSTAASRAAMHAWEEERRLAKDAERRHRVTVHNQMIFQERQRKRRQALDPRAVYWIIMVLAREAEAEQIAMDDQHKAEVVSLMHSPRGFLFHDPAGR